MPPSARRDPIAAAPRARVSTTAPPRQRKPAPAAPGDGSARFRASMFTELHAAPLRRHRRGRRSGAAGGLPAARRQEARGARRGRTPATEVRCEKHGIRLRLEAETDAALDQALPRPVSPVRDSRPGTCAEARASACQDAALQSARRFVERATPARSRQTAHTAAAPGHDDAAVLAWHTARDRDHRAPDGERAAVDVCASRGLLPCPSLSGCARHGSPQLRRRIRETRSAPAADPRS